MNRTRQYLRNLEFGTMFMYRHEYYKFLGVTDNGLLCAYRMIDGKYSVLDVDIIVELVIPK